MTDDPRTQSTIPPDPIDPFFDGDLDEAGAHRLVSALRSDTTTADRFVRTQRAARRPRAPVESPDLTARILARLDQRRSFAGRLRRDWFGGWTGRFAAGLGLAAGIVSLYFLDRLTPTATRTANVPTPTVTPAPRPLSPTAMAHTIATQPAARGLGPLSPGVIDVHPPVASMPVTLVGAGNFRIHGPLDRPLEGFTPTGDVQWGRSSIPSFLGLPLPASADRIDLFNLPTHP